MTDQLTSNGLEIDDLQTRIDDIKADIHSISGLSSSNLESETPLGAIVGIFAEREQALAELLQEIYAGAYPDSAGGFQLDMVAAYTNTKRNEATKTIVECTVNVDPGTYNAGTLIGYIDGNPSQRFSNILSVVNGGGAPANFNTNFQCEDTGPIPAYSLTLTHIAEPVVGFNSIENANDHLSLGADEEQDTPLRKRRAAEVAQAGSTTTQAIRANLSSIDGVEWVVVLSNDTDVVDANGLPPHSIAVYVYAPTLSDATIAEAIWDAKASGIQTHGTTDETITDDYGFAHTISFTKVTLSTLYVEVDLDVNSVTYVGDSDVKTALADYADENWGVGDDVIRSQLIGVCISLDGVDDVTALKVGWTAPATLTVNLSVDWDELVNLQTANIVVNS